MFDAKKIRQDIVQWIRDYFAVNGPSAKAIIGISGGKDSTAVAALCVEALGKDRVIGIQLPQGLQSDFDEAADVIKYLGIQSHVFNIEPIVDGIYLSFGLFHGDNPALELNDVVKFNTPARIRMTILYAFSAMLGGRVANTCNKSEGWVGYDTKFGDDAGDFSPLKDFTVTEIKAIMREMGLPEKYIEKVPEDGMCGQSDEERFGFTYQELDTCIREGWAPKMALSKINALHRNSEHKRNPMPKFEYNP